MRIRNGATPYKASLHGKIVMAATQLFHERGIKAVKMDDIAKVLSISKRTLYEVFATKELLLEEVVRAHDEQYKRTIEQTVDAGGDVMDVIIAFYAAFVQELAGVSPQFFDDLEMYPHIISSMHANKEQKRKDADNFMMRGVQEGYFRDDVTLPILHEITDAFSRHVMETSLYKQYSMKEILRNLLIIIFRGMCTEKGLKKLDIFLKETFLHNA